MFTSSNRPAALLDRFRKSESGTVMMMAGLLFPALLMGVGGTLDFSRAAADRSTAQYAMDSTVLSLASQQLDASEIDGKGRTVFEQQVGLRNTGIGIASTSFQPLTGTGGGTGPQGISGEAEISTKSYFLGFFGIQDIKSTVTTSAMIPESIQHEIALVLDVSGSMGNALGATTKIAALEGAVAGMFTALEEQPQIGEELSVAVVPYSSSVNVGDVNPAALSAVSLDRMAAPPVGDDIWVAERYQSRTGKGFRLSDNSPLAEPVPFLTNGEVGGYGPVSRMLPLTDDAAAYGAATKNLVPYGGTAAHIGMAWGIYALSPSWSGIWSKAPAPFGSAEKYIVILTDGQFNTIYDIASPGRTAIESSNAYFLDACELAAEKGIKIFAVALALDADSEELLKDCVAKGDGLMLPADDAAALRGAFEDIARSIGKLRITS